MSTSKLLFWGLVAVMSTVIIIKVVLLVNANRETILRGFAEVSFKNLREFVTTNHTGAIGVIFRVLVEILIPWWNIPGCISQSEYEVTCGAVPGGVSGNIICSTPKYESDDNPPPNPNT